MTDTPVAAAPPATSAAAPAAAAAPFSPPTTSNPSPSSADTSPSNVSPDGGTSAKTSGSASTPSNPESTPSLLSAAEGKKADTPEAPKEQPAPATEPAKADAKDPPKEAEAKPADPAATDPAKTADAIQPPAQVKYEELKIPEGMTLGEKESKAFLDVINDAKLDGKGKAQSLLDQHLAEIKRVHEQERANQHKAWNDTNQGWKDEFRKDPEVGGSQEQQQKSLGYAQAIIREVIPEPDIQARLMHYFDVSGMGNNPDVIRVFARLGQKFNAFEDKSVPAGKPPVPPKGPGNRGWYPSMQGG